jgi:predicted transglutaminase-like cysteine proteinase
VKKPFLPVGKSSATKSIPCRVFGIRDEMTSRRGATSAWLLLLPLIILSAAGVARGQDVSVPLDLPVRDSSNEAVPLSDFFCPDDGSTGPAAGDTAPGASAVPVQDSQNPEPECASPPPPLPKRPASPDLFRMVALPIGSPPSIDKWERARGDTLVGHAGPWTELLQEAGKVMDGHPLTMVNMWVNWHVRYQEDRNNDTWGDALSTLERGFGDCEDFAITKMTLLSELGVSADDMFLVLLRDRQRASHAVLAVRDRGAFYILDNRTDKLQLAQNITDYTPIVSYSGPFAWTYGRKLN